MLLILHDITYFHLDMISLTYYHLLVIFLISVLASVSFRCKEAKFRSTHAI